MAKYTTCLECGSVNVSETQFDKGTLYECDDCENQAFALAASSSVSRVPDGFETMTGAEVKELRA